MALSRTREMGVGPEGEVRKEYPQEALAAFKCSLSLKKHGLSSLGISLGEKPAMPVIRVVKGRVRGF